MRIERDKLTFKALCALHEIAERAASEPIPPSFGLRFLLAYLYAVSDAPLWLIKQVWRDLQAPDEDRVTGTMAQYPRASAASTAFAALSRHCGVEMSPTTRAEFDDYMRRNGPPEQRAKQALLDAVRDGPREKAALKRERQCR